MIPPMVQMQPQGGYYVAPAPFQPSHSHPPPNSYVAGQQIIQNTSGFVSAQQFYQQGGHPMVMGQSAVSHGYPSTANQTLPTSSIASSHQMIPMVQNPMNYPLNNGSLQMVLPMHQMTYYPPVTVSHSGPPPNYMPGQPMVLSAPHGQYMNQPQFYQQNSNQ
uniref:Uncharacterized protein n=1 Tax=Ditylenchus dipsaci TaxID=166011 RepID=A0A915EBA3_9BILA